MGLNFGFVIDFQYFKGPAPQKHLIIKEIAICAVSTNLTNNWLVRPPQTLNYLFNGFNADEQFLRQLKFTRDHIHGIDYFEGYTPFSDCINHIREICWNAKAIFVKGSERVNFTNDVIFQNSIPIIDLDKCACPTFNTLYNELGEEEKSKFEPVCFHLVHSNDYRLHCKEYRCSLKQAWTFKLWLNRMIQSAENIHPKKENYKNKIHNEASIGYDVCTQTYKADICLYYETMLSSLSSKCTLGSEEEDMSEKMSLETLNDDFIGLSCESM
jgi:hypothetical protein